MARSALFAFAISAALGLGGMAWAQARLVASTPADKAVAAPTARITLHFSEAVEPRVSGGNLIETAMMMNGRMTAMPMALGPLASAPDPADPKTLVLTARRPLSIGVYRLDWRATGTDKQPSQGSITFTVQ